MIRVKLVRLTATLSAVALIVTCSAATAASGKSGAAAAPYNVGIVVSLTGNGNASGQPWNAAVQTVFKSVNAQGGIKGHKIKWRVYDDQSSVTVSPAVAQQALGANPVAIMDGTITTYYNTRQPVYESAQIPVFTDSGIVDIYPWRYSNFMTVPQIALSFVSMTKGLLHGALRGKRIAIVGANTPGVRGQVPIIQRLLEEQNAELVEIEYQTVGAPSFTSGAANIIASKPDLVLISDTDADAIVTTRAMRDAGYKGPFLSNFGASSLQTMKAMNDPRYYGQQLSKPVLKGTLAYTLAKKYGTLKYSDTLRYGMGFILAQTLVKGLRNCAYPCKPSALTKAVDSLGQFNVPGGLTWGKMVVSPTTHNITQTFGLYTWNPAKKKFVQQPFKFKMGPTGY